MTSPPSAAGGEGARLVGFEALERISTLGPLWQAQQAEALLGQPPGYVVEGAAAVREPGGAVVQALASALRAALDLQLFNFDLIRVTGERDRFLVVDINYFPGIAKMPGYTAVFSAFLAAQAADSRRRRAAGAGGMHV